MQGSTLINIRKQDPILRSPLLAVSLQGVIEFSSGLQQGSPKLHGNLPDKEEKKEKKRIVAGC